MHATKKQTKAKSEDPVEITVAGTYAINEALVALTKRIAALEERVEELE